MELGLAFASPAPCTVPAAGRRSVNICRMNGWRAARESRGWHDGVVRTDKVLREDFSEEAKPGVLNDG